MNAELVLFLLRLISGVLLIVATLSAQLPGPEALATIPVKSEPPAAPTRPAWNELTPAQREALAPLAAMWPTLEADSKQKWLEVARLICEEHVPPRDVIARTDASPLDVEETLKDLVRRGVVTLKKA